MYQNPNEFSKYLLTLSKFNINTYLEIGTFLGGSFITTVEYFMKFNPKFKYAVGIDVNYYISMAIYAKFNKNIRYLIMDSKSLAFKNYIDRSPNFDLIFIDSDVTSEGRKRSFEIIKGKAKMIALHDILGKEGYDVWKYIKDTYKKDFIFLEFTDHYLKDGKCLGIGLLIKKEFH